MEKENKVICSQCGHSVEPLDLLCPYCGAELRPAMTKGKKRKWKAVFLLLAVLGGICILNADEIRSVIWDIQLETEQRRWEEEKYENFDYEFYTISQEERAALDEGDFYMEENWEQQFSKLSPEQTEALRLLRGMVKTGISRREALRNLQRQGYSEEDALAVVEAAEIDFSKMALKAAYDYLGQFPYSEKSLAGQLESCGFTEEESAYAAKNCGADWNQQARIQLMEMMTWGSRSEASYLLRLEEMGYTPDQAEQAVNAMDIDWNIQASRTAADYLEDEKMDRTRMIEQLEYEGFTHEQAVYGADAAGLK